MLTKSQLKQIIKMYELGDSDDTILDAINNKPRNVDVYGADGMIQYSDMPLAKAARKMNLPLKDLVNALSQEGCYEAYDHAYYPPARYTVIWAGTAYSHK